MQLSRFFIKKTYLKILFYTSCLILLVLISNPHKCKTTTPKTRQYEARRELEDIYDFQRELHSRYGTYATCIEDSGYQKKPWGFYIVGFSGVDQNSRDLILSKGGKCNSPSYITPIEWYNKFDKNLVPKTEISANKFTAFAIGKVSYDSEYPLDIWTIDQNGKLVHIQDGSRSTSFKKRISDWYNYR